MVNLSLSVAAQVPDISMEWQRQPELQLGIILLQMQRYTFHSLAVFFVHDFYSDKLFSSTFSFWLNKPHLCIQSHLWWFILVGWVAGEMKQLKRENAAGTDCCFSAFGVCSGFQNLRPGRRDRLAIHGRLRFDLSSLEAKPAKPAPSTSYL